VRCRDSEDDAGMVNYRWSVCWADLGITLGSEQAGRRPVLIISSDEVNQSLPIVTVVPLTSSKPGRRVYPTEALITAACSGLTCDSIAMAHQIRTIAKVRLGEACGRVDDASTREMILKAVHRHLGFDVL
jgi:mRNA interferase MazF